MRKRAKVLLVTLFGMVALLLSTSAAQASLPYYPIDFPRDHGGHQSNIPYIYPNDYWSEWWYFNGKLTTLSDKEYYYMVSIHQHNSLMTDGTTQPIYLTNIQITDLQSEVSRSKQRLYLFPAASVYVSDTELDVSYGLWNLGDPSNFDAFVLKKNEATGEFKLKGRALVDGKWIRVDLKLTPTIPEDEALMVNGTGKMEIPSVPGVPSDMYYYTYPEMTTTGTFTFDNIPHFVKSCKSTSWMDHQWGDYTPTPAYSWDWFALRLDDGTIGNIYINTVNPAKTIENGYASFILPDGSRVYETIGADFDWTRSDYWTASNGMSYPMTHELNFDSIDLSVTIHSDIEDQFVSGPVAHFWEGYCTAEGTLDGDPVTGFAYKELWYSDYGSE